MTLARPRLGKPAASPEEIFAALFRPMGVDGVYGRAGAYETIVEALGALHRHGARREGRGRPLSAGGQPRADREVRLSQELSASPGLRLRARRRREAHRRGGRAVRGGRILDRRRWRRASSCWRRRPAIPSTQWPPRAARSLGKACCSTSPAIAFAASPRATSTACSPSACANSSPSALPTRRPPSAIAGRIAPPASPTRSG